MWTNLPPVTSDKIDILPIKQEGFRLVLSKAHPLAEVEEPIDVANIRDMNFIMTPEQSGKGYYDSVISVCKSAGFYPKITQQAQEQQTIISLVASELGVAIVPESSTRIANDEVVFRKIEQKHKKTTALAWHKDSQSPGVQLFMTLIKEMLKDGRIK